MKSLNPKDIRRNISVPLAMSTNLYKKIQTSKKNKKTNPGWMLGQDRLEKSSAKCLIRSGEIPSPRQTSIDQTNDYVMKSERDALVRGSYPP